MYAKVREKKQPTIAAIFIIIKYCCKRRKTTYTEKNKSLQRLG